MNSLKIESLAYEIVKELTGKSEPDLGKVLATAREIKKESRNVPTEK